MNLFDSLVGEVLKNQPTLAALRPVVENETFFTFYRVAYYTAK